MDTVMYNFVTMFNIS